MVRPETVTVGVRDQIRTSSGPAIFTWRPKRALANRSIGPLNWFQSRNVKATITATTSAARLTPVYSSAARRVGLMTIDCSVPGSAIMLNEAAAAWRQQLTKRSVSARRFSARALDIRGGQERKT